MALKKYKLGTPFIDIRHRYIVSDINTTDNDYLAVALVESVKGDPNKPIIIRNNDGNGYQRFLQELKPVESVDEKVFFECGGTNLAVVRVAAEDEDNDILITRAKHVLKVRVADRDVDGILLGTYTVKDLCTLYLKPGDYEVKIGASFSNGMNKISIREDDILERKQSFNPRSLVRQIKDSSVIIDFVEFDEVFVNSLTADDEIETIPETVFGTGTGNSPGSNGVDIDDSNRVQVYSKALRTLYADKRINPAILYMPSEIAEDVGLRELFIDHIIESHASRDGKWRNLVISTLDDATLNEKIQTAESLNHEEIWCVGDDLEKDGVIWTPRRIVPAIAALITRMPYYFAPFGGTDGKTDIEEGINRCIGDGLRNYFTGIGTLLDDQDYDILNEAGLITFEEDEFGFKMREDPTTAQPSAFETDTDRITKTRIVQHTKRAVRKALKRFIGANITDVLKTEIEQVVYDVLKIMKDEGSLIDVSDYDGTLLYPFGFVEVELFTKEDMRLGAIDVLLRINPVDQVRSETVRMEVT